MPAGLQEIVEDLTSFAWPKTRAAAIRLALEAHVSGDEDERARGLSDLRVEIADQDVVGSLAARAYPPLLALACHAEHAGGGDLLRWLVELVLGDHREWLSDGCHPAREARTYFAGPEGRYLRACYRALEGASAPLLALLEHHAAERRATAAFALAWLGAHPEVIAPIAQAARSEADPAAASSLWVALGLLARHHAGLEQLAPTSAPPPEQRLAVSWAHAVQRGRTPDDALAALLHAYREPRAPEGPFAIADHEPLLRQLGREDELERRAVVEAAALDALSGPRALDAARFLLARRFDEPPSLGSLTDDQRALLVAIAEQPLCDEAARARQLGLPPRDELRRELGLAPLGAPTALDAAVDETTARDLWVGAACGDSPAALLEFIGAMDDPWPVYFEGAQEDRRREAGVAPAVLERLVRPSSGARWSTLLAFADRALTARAQLPRPLDRWDGLARELLRATAAMLRAGAEASAADLARVDALIDEAQRVHGPSEQPDVRRVLESLPPAEAEARVLALLEQSPDAPDRYVSAAPSSAVARRALEGMAAKVAAGVFARGSVSRDKKKRQARKRTLAARWASALTADLVGRLAELAREPVFALGKTDDRDLYVLMLIELLPSSAEALVALLDDGSKPIRALALEGLSALPKPALEPHLGPLRASNKKAHREALAALE